MLLGACYLSLRTQYVLLVACPMLPCAPQPGRTTILRPVIAQRSARALPASSRIRKEWLVEQANLAGEPACHHSPPTQRDYAKHVGIFAFCMRPSGSCQGWGGQLPFGPFAALDNLLHTLTRPLCRAENRIPAQM